MDESQNNNLRRGGPGRPKGALNKKTVARQASERAAAAAVLAGMSQEDIDKLMPLDVMLIAMRTEFIAGNLVQAATIGKAAADYCHSKKGIEGQAFELPPELQPDGSAPPGWVKSASGKLWPDDSQPPPISDEPGPPGGVIE